jgi:hypothetical protein
VCVTVNDSVIKVKALHVIQWKLRTGPRTQAKAASYENKITLVHCRCERKIRGYAHHKAYIPFIWIKLTVKHLVALTREAPAQKEK